MPKREITHDEVVEYLMKLPYVHFREIVSEYAKNSGADFEKEMDRMVTLNFQERLKSMGINSACPRCGSISSKKNGKRKHVQMYKCSDCAYQYTIFTETVVEKTRWHWDIWIKVLEMTINGYSIPKMITVLEEDYYCKGINIKTVWFVRTKLVHALGQMPMPVLSGVVQIDETFIRESQKGSRRLVNYVDKHDERRPRYGRVASSFGVMGPEFATITTAIDNRGYCVCKVTGLGRLTTAILMDMFDDHFEEISFLCSDSNRVYKEYCNLKQIPHYEKPSSYLNTIKEATEALTESLGLKGASFISEDAYERMMEKLYQNGSIDKIANMEYLPYDEFNLIKSRNGLNLARVNDLHSQIKLFINARQTNVSTKYLQNYIGFFTFIKNWRVDKGSYPSSQKDAEQIFIEILKSRHFLTVKKVRNSKLELPKPSPKYMETLKEETMKVRRLTYSKYFKFDEEDGFATFNKREYLLDQPKSKLYAICKECNLKGYRKLALYSLISLILKQPNIGEIIYTLLVEDRYYEVAQEDLDAIKAGKHLRIVR